MIEIQIKGLDEVLGKLAQWPEKVNGVMQTLMQASLMALWEHEPGYPPKPDGSTYDRTGTLGRTLGIEEGGGHAGQPDIFEVKPSGGFVEGHFGTRLGYAIYVIGQRQAWMHRGRWWTILDIATSAADEIRSLWQRGKDEIVAWFNGG